MLLIDETIGKRISYYRKKRNLRQYELAIKTGTKSGYLSDIETGRVKPSIDLLARLAAALEITIDELVHW